VSDHVFRRPTGGLILASACGILMFAVSAAAQSAGPAVFVANNGNLEGSVTAFRVEDNGALMFVNRIVTGSRPSTTQPCSGCNAYEISLSPNGRWLASGHAAGDLDGITIFEVAEDASITQRYHLALASPIGGILDLVWIDDTRLAATRLDSTPDRVAIYEWNPAVPSLTEIGPATNIPSSGLGYLAVDRARGILFANSTVVDTVYSFDVNGGSPMPVIDEEVSDPTFPLELTLTPDGRYLYAAGGISNSGNKVVAIRVSPDGTMEQVPGSPFISGGASPSNVYVSGDGRFLLVGHGTDATLRVMEINPDTGAIGYTGHFFDVGAQGTFGDVASIDNIAFVVDNSTSLDGIQGVYSFRIEENGALTQIGLVDTQGIAPRSLAVWGSLSSPLLGDLNCDGVLSVSDIGPFVLALTDPAGYAAEFPNCDVNLADMNGDGIISVSDIGPFVAVLTK
jgi:6-phosphogluconolactonase (cycloisomerase 2 family)